MRTSDPGSQVRALVRPHEIKHLSLIFRTSGAAFRSGATFGATSIIIFLEAAAKRAAPGKRPSQG